MVCLHVPRFLSQPPRVGPVDPMVLHQMRCLDYSHLLSVAEGTEEQGLDIFLAQLTLLKNKAQLSNLEMAVDCVRLEGHYEGQTLHQLVAATQPLEEGETEESRNTALMLLTRSSSDVGHTTPKKAQSDHTTRNTSR
jgi:hypothetical protein